MNRGFKDIKLICLLTILIFCVFLFGCSEDKAKTKPASEKQSTTEKTDNDDFTLLIYMCGSSLESKNGSASDDISELLSAEIPDKVNVVLETGGWDYKAVAEALGTKSFYDVILNSYEKSHHDSDNYTLSAIKLTEFDKVKAVLSQCIDKAEKSNNKLIMSKAVQECESFGSSIAYLYDFGDIADYFDVDYDFSRIIKAVKSETKSNISGLNICFPSDDEKALENYLMISEDKNYCDYLKNNY